MAKKNNTTGKVDDKKNTAPKDRVNKVGKSNFNQQLQEKGAQPHPWFRGMDE